MEHEPLIAGNCYHIFNRGNNRGKLFSKTEEYEHFLHLYDKYILPVADTFAWALMGNHFHFLVRIKANIVYKYSMQELETMKLTSYAYEERKWETIDADLSASLRPDNVGLITDNNDGDFNADRSKVAVRFRKPIPHRHFAHLFNAYTRYLQIRTGSTGNLFERPFKRKMVDTYDYLKTAVLYIHNNPVHHGFCSHPIEYPWTSYITSISEKPTKLKRDEVIKLFNDSENFKQQHNKKIDFAEIETWLEIAPSDLHDFDDDIFDADRSMDAVRSEEDVDRFEERSVEGSVEAAADFDLSAREAPDNVKMKEDNI